ncbi:hypothetical protein HY750_01905 [Candidatus Kuenenbacteria bacterium]|nr:hypothetical protein [Candidatus Kuenenbacteria bacterium]
MEIETITNIKKIETPKFKKEIAGPLTPIHMEIHEKNIIEVNKKAVELTRKEILKKYNNIPEKNRIILPIPKGSQYQRVVRCFVIIDNINMGNYYIEGSTDHAILIRNFIFQNNVSQRDIDNNNLWKIKKGIIDPFGKNFESYPQVRKELEILKEQNQWEGVIPNWVLTFEHSAPENN